MTVAIYHNMETGVVCPKCGQAKLLVVHEKPNNTPFLWCPRWPDCWSWNDIPEDMKPYEIVWVNLPEATVAPEA